MLYYTNIRLHNFHLQLHIAPHDQEYLKVCITFNTFFLTAMMYNAFQEIHWDVKGKFGHHFEGGPVSLFERDKGSPAIHLDVPKDPVLGWTMKLVDTNEVCLYSYLTSPEQSIATSLSAILSSYIQSVLFMHIPSCNSLMLCSLCVTTTICPIYKKRMP